MRGDAVRLGIPLAAVIVMVLILGWNQWNERRNDPFRANAIERESFPSLSYGMQIFLWWDDYAGSLALHWLNQAQFTHVKQVFAWKDIQPRPDLWLFDRADAIVEEALAKGICARDTVGECAGMGSTRC